MRLRSIAKALVLVVLGLVVVGIVSEKIGEHRDRTRYPQIGRSVDIGGRTLNIFCSGAGGPTVVFEGAGHTAGYAWVDIQSQVAKFTRACWYDRAGYGWSDPGPSPRTFEAIAEDLHGLLHAASVPPPYVLVGATAGAFHVRVYNGLYSKEVAGAVLIDATDSDVFAHEPEYMKGHLSSLPPFLKRIGCDVAWPAMVRVGLVRLLGNPGAGQPFGLGALDQNQQRELWFLSDNPSVALTQGEACTLQRSMSEVSAAGNFGGDPLIVLSRAEPFRAPGPQFKKATAALNDYYFKQLQPRLAALSTRGHLVLAKDPAAPDGIVHAVREVVEVVRAGEHKE